MTFTPLDLLDVSSLQGTIDWAAVRRGGYRGAYIRLTRGLEEVDALAADNLAGCLRNGLLPGFYHRAFHELGKPDVQALHFAMHLQRVAGPVRMLPPVLDYEDQAPGKEFCQTFLAAVRGYTGRRTQVIYTSGSFVDQWVGGESWMDPDIWLWIADSGKYTGATPGKPKYLTTRVVLHQHSGPQPNVPGIPADAPNPLCDVNRSTGDLSQIVR
ncbi:glycoside hydrolase family 25 protein [Amycolatopsis suaedae]|uniref:Lysozyme n=1 Tax=Amycolatopsis suaedae TaxID=2510978 RepID=A0A4V2EL63_9PSEU|nr:glycoside hydrolase family 25 protein [Amycolatopsis suaedae]RZQ60465.1 hypothetical protein EWH70_29675 [Amycolatopsis suaedae]